MTTAAVHMTAQDLLKMPSGHQRHELVRGELRTMPPTNDEHGVRTFNLTVAVGSFIREHNLGAGFGGETGFVIARNPDTVRAPDFAFVSKSRMAVQGLTGKFYPAAPDLAVEVLSPSDSASEILEKINEWLDAGARLVWVVDPEKKTVRIYSSSKPDKTLRIHDALDGEDVLPGLKLPLSDIFR